MLPNQKMTVSVIIPTYNRESLLGYAIDSVLKQTSPATELIIIDDGSEDNTERLVQRYGPSIRYIKQKNCGVGAARNLGISLAKGKYIAFLDSDDLWLDFKLDLQLAVLEKLPEVGFLFTEFAVLKDDGSKVPKGSQRWLAEVPDWPALYPRMHRAKELGIEVRGVAENFPIYIGNMYRQLLDSAYVLTSTAIVRRAALDESTRFTEGVTMFEDWEFYARLSRCHDGAFVDVETALNRGHSGPRLTGSSQLTKTQRYLSMLDQVWKKDEKFSKEYSEALKQAEGRALLAVARAALLSSKRSVVPEAVARWRKLKTRTGWYRAWFYFMLSFLPGGGSVLRLISKVRTAVRILTHGTRHGNYTVNPAA